jgi:DNA-binding NtrC family response regulator
MKKDFTILIADRNRHVREFLKREMTEDGYLVRLAKNCREVLECVSCHEDLDLLILDTDLPDTDEWIILEKLKECMPTLPVVVHTYLSAYVNHQDILNTTTLIEKRGSSVESLKKVVFDTLRKSSPQRIQASKDNEPHSEES